MARWQYQVEAVPPPQPPIFPFVSDQSELIFIQEFQYDVTVNPGVPILPSFGYFRPFIDPVRRNPTPLLTAQQEFFKTSPQPIIPSFGYFESLSEPVRIPLQLKASMQEFFKTENIPLVPAMDYFEALSEPVRSKPRLLEDLQQAYPSFVNPAAFPDFIAQYSWEYPFSEPVRFKPRLIEAAQQFFVIDAATLPPIIVTEWFNPLSEPVRFKHTFLDGLQQYLSFLELIPDASLDQFYFPFSEPVRFKPSLLAALQYYQETFVETPSIVTFTDLRWFNPLSEPVRYRWFQDDLQRSFTLTIPFFPQISYADVIVQTWNVLPEVDTWIINLDLTGCDCED